MINRTKFYVLNSILIVAIIINVGMYFWLSKQKTFDFDLKTLIPKQNGIWQSKDIPISDYLIKGVAADSEVWRHYYDTDGNKVQVWMAFYKDQVKSTAHNPNTCYSGQGWATEKRKDSLVLDDGKTLNMSRIFLMKGDQKSLSYYWYMSAGQNAGTEFAKNIYKFYHGLFKNRRDLLFLRFSIDVYDNDVNHAENTLKSFIRTFYPVLKSNFPASYSS